MSHSVAKHREEILAHQDHELHSLLKNVFAKNAFYQSKLKSAGLEDQDILATISLADLPFTTKEEIAQDQLTHPPYGSNLTFPINSYTRFSQTSGTTGTPIRWLDTPESWQWMVSSWKRVFSAADLAEAETVFFAFSFGPFLGFWLAYEAAIQLNLRAVPGGGMTTLARLQTIYDNLVSTVCATPTYAIRMGTVARENQIDLSASRVTRLIVAGEAGGSIPEVRSHIEKLWPGASVFDHHGMTEIGPVTYQCPNTPGVLHVIEDAYIPEIMDPETLTPVSPGSTGELVLTNLGRVGSPLIRYRTGDLVCATESTTCTCGTSELGLMGGILGRSDDMLNVRGVNIYPIAVEKIVRQFPEIVEFQVAIETIKSMDEISLLIETDGTTAAPPLAARLEEALKNAFSLRVPVTAVTPNSLPRYEMKARRWIRKS